MIVHIAPPGTAQRSLKGAPWQARQVSIGAAVWLAALLIQHPSPFDVAWAGTLLTFAPLVLVPLALRAIGRCVEREPLALRRLVDGALLPAAVLLQGAFLCDAGLLAAGLTVPWMLVTALIALRGLIRLIGREKRISPASLPDVGMIYLVVGGGWTLLSRAGLTPLDFKPVIVLLTGIHFHYAGFVLPIVAGRAAGRSVALLPRVTALLVAFSVPLVAVGITSTQLGGPAIVETGAALLMSFGGVLAAILQWRAAASIPATAPRVLLRLSSASLISAMVLAALYGLRHFGVATGLDIPWMRVLHGTTNVVGFALPALVAWAGVRRTGAVDLRAT